LCPYNIANDNCSWKNKSKHFFDLFAPWPDNFETPYAISWCLHLTAFVYGDFEVQTTASNREQSCKINFSD
jgi:hypothetical protein